MGEFSFSCLWRHFNHRLLVRYFNFYFEHGKTLLIFISKCFFYVELIYRKMSRKMWNHVKQPSCVRHHIKNREFVCKNKSWIFLQFVQIFSFSRVGFVDYLKKPFFFRQSG